MNLSKFAALFTALLAMAFITACSGTSSSSPTPTTTVSGSVFAGPASGTTVTVQTAAGAIVGGPVTTGSDGSFSIAITTAALANDLIFEATGGTFPDEATTTTGVALDSLSAHVPAGSLVTGANVSIDPSSTIIRQLVAAGKTRTAAEADFANAFGYTPDSSIKPAFANISCAATTQQRLAGLRAAAFSQLTKDLALTPAKQFELIQALVDDLGDGVLDGKKSGTAVTTVSGTAMPEDISNRFASALLAFQNSALNKSRLTADKIGAPVFNKTALTASYKVDYIPGTMAAAQGRTSFKIKLTNRSDGTPATGKSVALKPIMYMTTKSHTTPVDAVVDNGDGTYSCTAYYVMATAMNGIAMGVWELKVLIGAETAYFYPYVAMPMGNTALTKLSGITDVIMGMAGLEKRTYFLFNDGLTAGMGGTYTFNLFLATKETMTNFPAVSVGSSLKDQAGATWTVSTMAVEASTNGTSWVNATDNGNGHWSATGLTGLTSGTSGSIYVRLTINSEQKTTDGSTVAGANAFQTFAVIPGM